jgi:short-subunit dehydrogenase
MSMASFSHPRVIVITGASGGIGRALAADYAAPGVTLGLTGRNVEALKKVAAHCEQQGASVEIGVFDVTDAKASTGWLKVFDEKCPIDLLIANAGISSGVRPDGSPETWADIHRVIDVNLLGALAVVTPVVELMRERQNGQIALVSSLAAYRGLPSSPAYSASKAGLKVYGEALRGALRKEGVGVSVICPGYVVSPMSERLEGPKPLLLSAERAANNIRRGLARNRALITFPQPLGFGTWMLSLIPAWAADRILTQFRFGVKPNEK